MYRPFPVSTFLLILASHVIQPAGPGKANELTVDRIYASGQLQAKSFSANWAPGTDQFWTFEKSDQGGGQDLIFVDPATRKKNVFIAAKDLIPPGGNKPLTVAEFQSSKDQNKVLIFTNTRRVWRYHTRGDYWVYNRQSKKLQQLGKQFDSATLMFAKLFPDGRRAAYVQDRNIYVEQLETGKVQKMTSADTSEIINGTSDWVYEEELDVRDGFRVSPSGEQIAYWRFDTSGLQEFTMINNTDSLYPTLTKFKYPKAGTINSSVKGGIVDVASGSTTWFDLPGDPRNHYLARMEWIDSKRLLVQQLNRQQNENRVFIVDASSGKATRIFTDRDQAWVDVNDDLFWVDDRQKCTWVSERGDWKQIYLLDLATGQQSKITEGNYDVFEIVRFDAKRKKFYFIASPNQPTQRYLYSIELSGKNLTRISPANQKGTHQYKISPQANLALHTFSSFGVPPTVELVSLPDHKVLKTYTSNKDLKQKLGRLPSTEAEFIHVHAEDGTGIDGWQMRPPGFDPNKKYPLMLYVYGEPWGTTVTDAWGGNRYLWHKMLAEKGYVVMSFDNRGTKVPRGRNWRKSIYRQIGVLAANDQAQALVAAQKRFPFIDQKRVGIWGWSGGGSMSLNAIFKFPELYQTAISIAPVPDQRYYDTIYQERYMDTPQNNPEGYHNGSPIHFAKQLTGNLLVIHGTGDDNCHYQTMEKLINELIHHDRQFTMFAYPNRSHSIREGSNTTIHLRRLMLKFLLTNLPVNIPGQ